MSASALWPLILRYLRDCGDPAAAFLSALPEGVPEITPPALPADLARPAPKALANLASAPGARDLVQAIAAEAQNLTWRSSYSRADVGAFADGYAWAPIAAPDGPLVIPTGLVSIMAVGPNLHYPPHRHEPEELYAVVAGRAAFTSDRMPRRWLDPGGLIHHVPMEAHAMETGDSAALVLSVWTGNYQKSEILQKDAA